MAQKVKIFNGRNMERLEDRINEFLKEKPDIDYVLQSETGFDDTEDDTEWVTITIFYREARRQDEVVL